MLSLDVLLVSSLLAMPLAPVRQEPPPPPEPPAQPEPAPEPEPDPEPAPEPEPNIDEPPSEPGETPSEREIELEEQLAEARARAADLERMIEVLRQQLAEARAKAADLEPMINALQQQVAQLRAELEDQKLARESRSESQTPAALEAPSPTVQTIADPAGHSPQDPAAPEPSVAASAGPPADAPSAIRSWDEDPDDARPAPSAPARAPTPAPPADSAEALVTSIRGAYAARFPSVPSPAQRDAFDAFTADVVKWSAAQQRSLRRPVMWTVQFLRVEKGSGKDRMVRFIARSAVRTGPQGAGGTFVVRVPRAEAERLLKGDYRSGSFEVSGTLTPVVRFAPERPYDGISSTPSAFVGPYCEVSVALDTQSISPGS